MDFTKTILKGVKAWANNNFVNYNEQTLTDNQKAQVRENIGLVDPSGSFQELVTNEAGEQIWGERTHYEYTTEIVPETSYSAADIKEGFDFLPIYTPFEIIEGQEYIVIYNNIEYKTIGQKHAQEGVSGYFIGNAGFLTEEIENNNLPFLFMVPSDANLFPENVHGAFLPIDQLAGADTSKIKGTYSIKGLVAKKLDPKFYNTPDWNAQEGEDGYIKNRTHGLGEYIEYLPETEIELVDMGGGLYAIQITIPIGKTKEIKADQTYTITYDGVNYNYKFLEVEGGVGAGNVGLLMGQSNGDPIAIGFLPIENDDQNCYFLFADVNATASKTAKVKVSNEETRTVKLDKKYLPDGLFYMEKKGGQIIAQCDSITNDIDGNSTSLLYSLEEGRNYTIVIDGVSYQSVCKITNSPNITVPIKYLGNLSIYNSSNNDTGENYIFYQYVEESIDFLGYEFLNASNMVGKSFTITLNEEYNKIPSQHLPQPNWNANKGEEGYIENRTHYHIPGFTAHWDGVTEGKATANIGDITLYKISDNFLSIGYEKVLDLVGIQTEDGTIYKGWPLYHNNNNIMFQALSDNVSATFFSCADAGEGALFNPNNPSMPVGQYFAQESGLYIGSNSGLSSSTLDVIVLDETKQLDSMFIPDDFLYIKNGANESLVTSWSSNSDDLFGQHSLSLGFNSLAEGNYSFAIGMDTTAKGRDSFSSGYQTSAIGEDSHAEGMSTTAYGKGSHAEGYGVRLTCKLTGNPSEYYYTHNIPSNYNLQGLVGCVIEYNGYHTHISRITDTHINTWTSPLGSEPLDNAVVSIYPASSGDYTHTEGKGTNAIPACSHAEGDHTTAVSLYQHVQGRYNDTIYSSNCAHVVGNGTLEARSNAHTLNWDGTAWYAGDVYVGGTHQSDAAAKKLATEEYVDSAVANGGVSTEGLATEEYVNNAIANLVDSSPETLNTLNELSAALGDDPNFATTMTNQIAGKADKTTTINGKTLSENITLSASDVGALPDTTAIPSNLVNGAGSGSIEMRGMCSASGMCAFAEGGGTMFSSTVTGEGGALIYTCNSSLRIHDEIRYNNIIREVVDVNGSIITLDATLSEEPLSNATVWILWRTVASELNSHAEGYATKAFGENSHAEGYRTIASGTNSHAAGYATKAFGENSHAEGTGSYAVGENAHAGGNNSVARGRSSYARGNYAIAIGDHSYAENNIAIGRLSHAEGSHEIAGVAIEGEANATTYTYKNNPGAGYLQIGNFVYFGDGGEVATITDVTDTTFTLSKSLSSKPFNSVVRIIPGGGAIGDISHIEGEGTVALGESQHVQGRYNLSDSDNYAHIVGNGTSNAVRSNAHTLNWDGTAWFANDVYVGGTSQFDETTEKLVRKSELEEALTSVEVDEITSDEINAICGATIQLAEEVTY